MIAEIKADATKTVLLVEHKMDVVRALADRIIVSAQRRTGGRRQTRETVIGLPIVREIYLGVPAEAQA